MRLKPSWQDMAAILYRSGATLHEIGKTYGVHHVTVWRFLKKSKVRLRPKGRPRKVRQSAR